MSEKRTSEQNWDYWGMIIFWTLVILMMIGIF